jgi:hypothetical protein
MFLKMKNNFKTQLLQVLVKGSPKFPQRFTAMAPIPPLLAI